MVNADSQYIEYNLLDSYILLIGISFEFGVTIGQNCVAVSVTNAQVQADSAYGINLSLAAVFFRPMELKKQADL